MHIWINEWLADGWLVGWMDVRFCRNKEQVHPYLFFCLSFLYHIPPDLYTWGEDGSGEIRHINAHEVTNFLSSCVEKTSILSEPQREGLGTTHITWDICINIGFGCCYCCFGEMGPYNLPYWGV